MLSEYFSKSFPCNGFVYYKNSPCLFSGFFAVQNKPQRLPPVKAAADQKSSGCGGALRPCLFQSAGRLPLGRFA
jgi:hypothetical protein